jgi:hypothetical protein
VNNNDSLYTRHLQLLEAKLDQKLSLKLVKLLKAGVKVTRIDAEIISGQEAITLAGTGVEIRWSPSLLSQDRPGWIISETYAVIDIDSGEPRETSEVVSALPAEDIFAVTEEAIIAIVRRRLESALSEASL